MHLRPSSKLGYLSFKTAFIESGPLTLGLSVSAVPMVELGRGRLPWSKPLSRNPLDTLAAFCTLGVFGRAPLALALSCADKYKVNFNTFKTYLTS